MPLSPKNSPNVDPNERELAVYDSLIEGLAERAVRTGASAGSFFTKSSEVIDAIFAPNWSAVLARGPSDSPIVVHATGNAKDNLGDLFSSSKGSGCRVEDLLNRRQQLQSSGLVVSPISHSGRAPDESSNDGHSRAWGCLIVDLGSTQPDLVQLNVVSAIAETAGEFVRNQDLNRAEVVAQFDSDVLKFSLNAHCSLEPRVVGHHLANDARMLLDCERVSVFMINGTAPRLLAISSVASVEGRSQLVKRMNSMVRRSTVLNEPIISDQTSADKRLEQLVESHRSSTGLPFVFGVPVYPRPDQAESPSGSPIGFLLAESTQDIDRVQFARGLSHVGPHAAVSLSNVNTYSRIPFRRSLGWLGRAFSSANISRLGVAAVLAGVAIAASLLIKADFKVRIPGELRPAVERNVFASQTGVIEEVFVDHGDEVKTNQSLMRIRSSKLEVDLEKASSDVLKLQELKEAKQIALNRVSDVGSDQNLAAQLASEISDLEFQIATSGEKAKFLKQQISELLIVSPIDGQVTTWQAKDSLTTRPVEWGDPIINVAELDGDWNLIFRVPERRIGYVIARKEELESGEPLELEFFLESDPTKRYRVEVMKIDRSAVADPELGPVTILECRAPDEMVNKRQGATISGDVDCGRKSIWYVWTREMFDSVRRHFVW